MARLDWTDEDLNNALSRASEGKGGKLAKLIKATSEADLAYGLSQAKGNIRFALYFCSGMRGFRREMKEERQRRRKQNSI